VKRVKRFYGIDTCAQIDDLATKLELDVSGGKGKAQFTINQLLN
jgi:hypothetical protein